MADEIVYRRKLPHGPEVRLRRTSPTGATPVTMVLDVDRRAGTPREGLGTPPALKEARCATEAECIEALRIEADDDRLVVGLMRAKGQR